MTIKERLREIRNIDRRIDIINKNLDSMRAHFTAVDYSKIRVQGSLQGDLSNVIAQIDRYEAHLNQEIEALYGKKMEMQKLIDRVLQSPYWDVITLYYFDSGNTWEKIATCLGYSYPQIQRIHGRALIELSSKDDTK